MKISPFFANLRSAYEAEIDDLAFDTDGRNVLRQRLADKQKHGGLDFLLQMIQSHPEMVAVLFHQAFVFHEPQRLQAVLALESEQVPGWPLHIGTALLPESQALAARVLQEPAGPWLLTVAAALEYLQSQSGARTDVAASASQADEDEDEDYEDSEEDASDGSEAHADAFDSDEHGNHGRTARERDEAGADWMEAQGFDRKK